MAEEERVVQHESGLGRVGVDGNGLGLLKENLIDVSGKMQIRVQGGASELAKLSDWRKVGG